MYPPQNQNPMMSLQPQQNQPAMSQNPHAMSPYTFVQSDSDRYPRTAGLGQMQGVEKIMEQLESQKTDLSLEKDLATYEYKKTQQAQNQMKRLMDALKGGGGSQIA